MSLVGNGQILVGSGNSPYIGDNGNWFVGLSDLGVHAGSDIHYSTKVKFANQTDEGVYFVYDDETFSMTIYHVTESGTKHVIADKSVIVPTTGANGNWFIGTTDTGIPVSGDGSTIAGAAINDDVTDGTTTWSSAKVQTELDNLSNGVVKGKSLEFKWEGTKLGIRLYGEEDYAFVDLKGLPGMNGVNGDSVIDAAMNESGELVLQVVEVDNIDPHRLLSFENGIVTMEDMNTITENITRLNKEVQSLKEQLYNLTNNVEE